MSFKIRVTQENIDQATRELSSKCMVADAVRACVPGSVNIHADVSTIRWSKGSKRYIHPTPSKGQAAISNWDAGMPVEPFEMTLSRPLVVEVQKRGPRQRKTVTATAREDGKGVRVEVSGGQAPRVVRRDRQFGARNLRWNQLAGWEPTKA